LQIGVFKENVDNTASRVASEWPILGSFFGQAVSVSSTTTIWVLSYESYQVINSCQLSSPTAEHENQAASTTRNPAFICGLAITSIGTIDFKLYKTNETHKQTNLKLNLLLPLNYHERQEPKSRCRTEEVPLQYVQCERCSAWQQEWYLTPRKFAGRSPNLQRIIQLTI